MMFLTVLTLIVGALVLMTAGLLGLSYALGLYLYSGERAREIPAATGPCVQCDADRDWYLALPAWKQHLISAWWWANRIECGWKGCR